MTRRTLLGGLPGGIMLLAARPERRSDSTRMMEDAAGNLLASLSADQRAKASFAFNDEERFNWHFIPRERKGLPLREMTPAQRHLAAALLAAGLSRRGLIKANTIMSLEDVLRVLENDSGERRNPEKYYFSLFGQPSRDRPWGYRVEGHHLSLNYTIAGDRIAAGPGFFGANPAEVRHGPRAGLRTLAAEEDLARDLMGALTQEQRGIAIVNDKAYPDILTSASRTAALKGQPSGLAIGRMNGRQRDLLASLVSEYAHNVPEDVAQARVDKLAKAGAGVHFAWAGSIERKGPHYYRVQAPSFLIEYDNTQNEANHIHSVWRDLDQGDWGLDILGAHYSADHD